MTEPGGRPRDPRRSLRAIAAVLLTLESLSVALALALLAAAGMLRRRAGRPVATLLQPLVILAGIAAWPLYLLGALFGALWVGVLWMDSGLPTPEPSPPAG